MDSKYGVKRRVFLILLIFTQKSKERKARKVNVVNTAFTYRYKYAGSTHSQQLSIDSKYE